MENKVAIKMKPLSLASTLLFLLIAIDPSKAEERGILLSPSTLDLTAVNGHEFREVSGRQAFCLDGVALLRDVDLREGAVVVDVASTGKRQFANLVFRARDAANYEDAYLRLHKTRQPDAVQYTPVIKGETNWQLFRQYQTEADLGTGDWVTLRVDFVGDRALVTIDGAASARLSVDDLVLDDKGTRLGLGSNGGACFSNLRITRAVSLPPATPDVAAAVPAGTIMSWSLSPVTPFDAFAQAMPVAGPDWSVAEAEREGVLLISRYRAKTSPASSGRSSGDVVYAGVTLRSERAQIVELEFDASDRARVYLNGSPLAEFDNSFRAKGPLFRGDFDMSRQRLFLPLRKGDNALVFGVADQANGWGLAARLLNSPAVEVRTPER